MGQDQTRTSTSATVGENKIMTKEERFKTKVKAGIALLNVARPTWLTRIDLGRLDLASTNS